MSINSITGNTLLTSGSFPPARVATTSGNINLQSIGLATIDGVALVGGDRVLVKDQTDATQNGIYAASTGPWTRTSDAAGNQNFFSGMAVTVALGTTNGGKTFLCTTTDDPVVVGTSLITFVAQSVIITAGITINAGLINQLAYYASAGSALSALATANNGVLITSGAGAPSVGTTLPTAVQGNITQLGTVTVGAWHGTVIGATYGGTGVNNGSNTLTLAGNLTIATNGGTIAFGAASKTLTVDNSLEFAGTDSTKFTFPSTTDTVATLTAAQTLTGKTLTSPVISGGTIDNAPVGATTPAAGTFTTLLAGNLSGYAVKATGINFNSANSDTTIAVPLPPGVTNYQILNLRIANASGIISTATFGLFSAAAGGGTAIITNNAFAITVTTASANSNNNSQTVTPTNSTVQSWNFANLFFRVGTAQGTAATADVIITIVPLY